MSLHQDVPTPSMIWAAEVDRVHAGRLAHIIRSLGHPCCHQYQQRRKSFGADMSSDSSMEQSYLYCPVNFTMLKRFPFECLKYVVRTFYVPNTCSDPANIAIQLNRELKTMTTTHRIHNQGGDNSFHNILLRVTTAPKHLEDLIMTHVLTKSIETTTTATQALSTTFDWQFHPTCHNTVLMCVYSSNVGLFRWGVLTRQRSEEQEGGECTTVEALASRLNSLRLIHFPKADLEPVCRAYHKLDQALVFIADKLRSRSERSQEVQGDIFGLLGEAGIVAVDIGASPGGWTQRLAPLCHRVLAVDAAALHPRVTAISNVTHIQHNVPSPELSEALRHCSHLSRSSSECRASTRSLAGTSTPVTCLVVCDANFGPSEAAYLLTAHVLPWVHGFAACPCSSSRSSSSSSQERIEIDSRFTSEDSPTKNTSLPCPGRNEFEGCGSCELGGPDSWLVLTLKLQKGPKPRHIEQAVRAVLTALAPLECMCNGVGTDYDLCNCKRLGHCACFYRPTWGLQHAWPTQWPPDIVGPEVRLGPDGWLLHLAANSANERTLVLRRRRARF